MTVDDGVVKRKALHEAAHVVVGMALGLRLLRVTINEDDGAGGVYFEPLGRGAPPRAESMSMLFAGALAETRCGVDEQATAASGRYDMERINDIATALGSPEDVPALVASARERAASLVELGRHQMAQLRAARGRRHAHRRFSARRAEAGRTARSLKALRT